MAIVLDTTEIAVAVTAVVSAVTSSLVTARRFVRPLLDMTKQWREFREDWQGVPNRAGFPGHPGMPERMLATEQAVEAIRAELVTNGGSTLKDAIRRIEAQQTVSAIHAGAPLLAGPNHLASSGTVGSGAVVPTEREAA